MRQRTVAAKPPRWDPEAELTLLRDLATKNFWYFFLDVFGAGTNPKGEKWIEESVHRPLCDWFQHHVDQWFDDRLNKRNRGKRLAVLVPRGVGKTTLVTSAGLLWMHARDPELSSYIGCESSKLAIKILQGIKAVLDGSDPYALFPKLLGNWETSARQWSSDQATHGARKNTSRKDPSFGIFSVESSITGAHPDVIIYDDPISYERLMTDTNWLNSVWSQVVSLVPVLQSDGLLIWVGTRYDDTDHFGRAFKEEGVKTLNGMDTDSIVTDDEGAWDVYFMSARDKDGKPTCRKVWPDGALTKYEKVDPLRYSAQVLNDPNLSEGNPITREMLEKECVVKSDDVPWGTMKYAALCDTAFWDGRSKSRKDETVVIIAGYPANGSGDVYYIEGYGSNRWRGEDLAKRIVELVQRYRRQGRRFFAITDEVTMAGKKGMWELNLRNYFADAGEPMPMFKEFQRGGHGRKAERIVAFAQMIVHGHVKFVESAPGLNRLIDQLCRIEQMKISRRISDDWADAMSDSIHPELYNPMRQAKFTGRQNPPWERGSMLMEVEGLDMEDFRDDDWRKECPRPPIT
jgi:hypothetical protein